MSASAAVPVLYLVRGPWPCPTLLPILFHFSRSRPCHGSALEGAYLVMIVTLGHDFAQTRKDLFTNLSAVQLRSNAPN